MAFFRPKRRKQAFIGRQNKRPSSAVLLPDAVARWRGRRALLQSPCGRHEVNIAEKRYPPPSPSPAVVFFMYSDSVLYAVSLFGCYIVLLLSVHVSVDLYIVLILDCVGYFHRPKKPLIQPRYTHISECFLLARLRRLINTITRRILKILS